MKMKKFLSSLTAGVMAATTIFTSALVTPMMSFIATAADGDVLGTAYLTGTIGGNNIWNDGTNAEHLQPIDITGNGAYSAEFEIYNNGSENISCLILQTDLKGETYYDAKLTIDSIVVDGTAVAGYTQSENAQVADGGGWRVNLYNVWTNPNITDLSGTTAVNESLVVNFTVAGLPVDKPDIPIATGTTETQPVVTTAASSEATTQTTVTTAPPKKTVELTNLENKSEEGEDGNLYKYVEFSPFQDGKTAISATAYYTISTDDNNTTYAFGTWINDRPVGEQWVQDQTSDADVPSDKKVVTKSFAIPTDVEQDVKFSVYYPGEAGVTIDKIVLEFDDVSEETTSATSETTTVSESEKVSESVSVEETTTVSETEKVTESVEASTAASETEKVTESVEVSTAASETEKVTESVEVSTAASETEKVTESVEASTAASETEKVSETTKASETEKATQSAAETSKVTTAVTTAKPINTTATEAPKGKGIVIDIGEVDVPYSENEDDYYEYELPITIKNAVSSLGMSFTLDIPEVTARILTLSFGDDSFSSYIPNAKEMKNLQGYGKYTENRGASGTEVDTSMEDIDRWLYFMWTAKESAYDMKDGEICSVMFDVSPNAAKVAKEAGLPLQTDENGNKYYFFPVNYAEYRVVNWDFTGEYADNPNNPYLLPNCEYLNDVSQGQDIQADDVTYYTGGFRVYTDEVEQPDEKPVNMDIDEMYVYPEDVEMPLYIRVTAQEGAGINSYGLSGAMNIPVPTADLMELSFGANSSATYFGAKNQVNLSDFIAYKNGTSSITDGSDRWIRFILTKNSGEAAEDPAAKVSQDIEGNDIKGVIVSLMFDVPDADTVKKIAEANGLELLTGEYEGNEITYYEFPLDWAPNGVDLMPSGEDMVEVDRFTYLNDEGSEGVNVFGDQIGLKNGAIRVIMSEKPFETTTTTSEVTTTETTTTTSESEETTTTSATTSESEEATTTSAATTSTAASSATTVTTTTKDTESEPATTTSTEAVTTVSSETETEPSSATTVSSETETETEPSSATTASSTTESSATTTTAVSTTKQNFTKGSQLFTSTSSTTATTVTTVTTETSDSETETTTVSTEITFPIGTTTIVVKSVSDANFYFSVDNRNFKAADLISVYAVDEEKQEQEVTADHLAFEYATPAEMFEAEKGDNAYVAAELTVYYVDGDVKVELDAKPMIYIGVKGDANLDGEVDTFDAYYTLLYYAKVGAGYDDVKLLAKTPSDPNLETLAYFLADVDTESKAGQDTDDKLLDTFDAYYQLLYYARLGAGYTDTTWPDCIPSLKKLPDSCWAE